jgi:hypothetical protein
MKVSQNCPNGPIKLVGGPYGLTRPEGLKTRQPSIGPIGPLALRRRLFHN